MAAYLAKYVTKSVAEFGLGLRRMSPLAVAELDVRGRVRAILTTIAAWPLTAPTRAWNAGYTPWGIKGTSRPNPRCSSTTIEALRVPSRLDPPTTRRPSHDNQGHGTSSGDVH